MEGFGFPQNLRCLCSMAYFGRLAFYCVSRSAYKPEHLTSDIRKSEAMGVWMCCVQTHQQADWSRHRSPCKIHLSPEGVWDILGMRRSCRTRAGMSLNAHSPIRDGMTGLASRNGSCCLESRSELDAVKRRHNTSHGVVFLSQPVLCLDTCRERLKYDCQVAAH